MRQSRDQIQVDVWDSVRSQEFDIVLYRIGRVPPSGMPKLSFVE
jgi:hypothetical protein